MTFQSDTLSDSAPGMRAAAPAALAATQPFYWSVRRELWEHRSLVIAPLAAAGVVLFGLILSLFQLGHHVRDLAGAQPLAQQGLLTAPFAISAAAILVTAFIVAVFYCVSALHNERRDRSILFWKSLPVSDLTTVLSKAVIPLVVLPMISVVVVIATQLVAFVLTAAVLAGNGFSPSLLWTEVPFAKMELLLVYGVAALALWHAPIYGWLLLVSGWAKRGPFLWAILPPLALCLIEKIAFGTGYLGNMLKNRIAGGIDQAFTYIPVHNPTVMPMPQLNPVGFVTSPQVWIGLLVAAGFITASVWLRRYREPV